MALWTMTPDGTRLVVIAAHRAYAADMTEDESLTGEQSERLLAALREMNAGMGHAVHYGPGMLSSAGGSPWECTGAMSRRPWPGATTAWIWPPRTWPPTTTTRAVVSTVGG